MERFIDSNIKNLTLNKYQSSTGEMNVDFCISEMEYVDTLIFITKYWIANKLHRTIRTFVTTSHTIYRRKFRKDVWNVRYIKNVEQVACRKTKMKLFAKHEKNYSGLQEVWKMKIEHLTANNIKDLFCQIDNVSSIGIGGLSGSGKSTFCSTIYNESIRRIITLLPKSEYRFLFSECLESNYTAYHIKEMPMVFIWKKDFSFNPRSTLGTHSGLFKKYVFSLQLNIKNPLNTFLLIIH